MIKNKNVTLFLYVAFGLSGAAALIYEVIWTRQLTLIFGTTLYAVSTVLAVFMAGLALGSFIFGKVADRSKNILRLYAYLEGGIGVYVLFTPLILGFISEIQNSFTINFSEFSIVRFGLSFLILLIPTTLMGGTLPVIVKFFAHSKERLGTQVGKLYAVNTLGGALGVFLAGFVLIVLLGVNATLYLAVTVNLLIAAAVFSISFRRKVSAPVLVPEDSPQNVQRLTLNKTIWAVLVGFGLAGFAALGLEVLWSRVLAMVLGSSVYAFSVILITFLLGIAFGSLIMSRFVDRLKNTLLWFVVLEIVIGTLVILLTPLLGYLPYLFLKIFEAMSGSFWSLQFMQFLLAGLVMILPAILMGAAFPLVAKICTPELKRVGRSIGNVYFANTVGAIFGPLMAGFIFIPLLGIQTSILVIGFIYLMIGGFIFFLTSTKGVMPKLYLGLFLGIIIASSFLIPSWNKNILNSGVYIYANMYLAQDPNLEAQTNEQLFYKEGLTATIVVEKRQDGHLALTINGKVDAGTKGDMNTQLMSGHLPMLLHKNPEDVLIIGLGSGITLGAVEQYEELRAVDSIEIEPAIVEAASYFSLHNYNALEDPRSNLIIADGRNYVLTTNKKYDVIIAEPSNLWVSGNSNLFTKEQFKLYKEHLKPEGIILQWAHTYKLQPEDVKIVVATFQEVFPHTTVWQSGLGRDIFMVGSNESLKIDLERWQAGIAREKIKTDLSRVHLDDPLLFLSRFVFDEKGARAYSEGAKIHTDNYPVLEFQTPKAVYLDPALTGGANLEALNKYRTNVFDVLQNVEDVSLREKIAVYTLARTHIIQGEIYFHQGDFFGRRIDEYEKALALIPNDTQTRKYLAKIFFSARDLYVSADFYKKIENSFLRAIEWNPEEPVFYQVLAETYRKQDNNEQAIWAYEQALKLEPDSVHFRLELGVLYGDRGLLDKAEQEFLRIIAQGESEENYLVYKNLATAYRLQGRVQEAIVQYQKSLKINPDQEDVRELIHQLSP